MNEAAAIPGQLAFDVDDLIRQAQRDRAGEWCGAPLGYTVEYYTPDEFAAAMDRYVLEHGHFGCRRSGCWSIALTRKDIIAGSHHVVFLDADAPEGSPGYQANCAPCRWHHLGSDNDVVEAAHDHTMPGWRDLPVMPRSLSKRLSTPTKQSTRAVQAWIEDNYPTEWQVPGAPVLTIRAPMATRHVAGRSPLDGYDLTAGTADATPETTDGVNS